MSAPFITWQNATRMYRLAISGAFDTPKKSKPRRKKKFKNQNALERIATSAHVAKRAYSHTSNGLQRVKTLASKVRNKPKKTTFKVRKHRRRLASGKTITVADPSRYSIEYNRTTNRMKITPPRRRK